MAAVLCDNLYSAIARVSRWVTPWHPFRLQGVEGSIKRPGLNIWHQFDHTFLVSPTKIL